MVATRILIAEDESIPRLDLKEMLENLGYQVVGEAADGRAAIELAREVQPDLVVMDVKMPEVDGIAAARVLVEERIAAVLLVSAYSDRDLVDGAKAAGVLGYVTKPFGEAQLVPAVEVALARFREFQALAKELGDTRTALETRRVVERAKGILMDRHGLKEEEAFRRIQKLSMDTRKSMREVAEAILLARQAEG
ncbi:MAG TPA: ANTAR domain-containing protein [Chloroflexota bacterium]|nr:ANTAR domain-containing protein [Chloroflexota bacterium]